MHDPFPEAAPPAPWASLTSAEPPAGWALLDTRSAADFARGHWPAAGRVAPAEFTPRRAELPPREVPVLVGHDDPSQAEAAAHALAALGYQRVRWWPLPLAGAPWGAADLAPAARLWRPSPFLAQVAEELPRGAVLDLAAGSGREAVWMALRGHAVEAWDRAPEALERARGLARAHGVTVDTREVDLERGPLPAPAAWPVVMVFRFLHRPLFPWIEAALAPGGMLVYETFRQGQERHGRPRHPRHLLEPAEFTRAFPTLEVLHHEELAGPEGPVMARLLARRPR